MTWAPTEAQKAIWKTLGGDSSLVTLLGATVEVQRITLSGTPASGTFKLGYDSDTTTAITGSGLSAATLQTAIRTLEGLESVTVALSSSNVYDITMTGVAGNPSAITFSENTLMTSAPAAITITISEQTAGVQRVFDHVPDDTAYPYVTLHILPWIDRGSHTYEGLASEIQIDTWYRSPGRGNLGVQNIQKRIDELLHKASICIEGWNIINLRRTYVDIETEDDNVTKRGIQRFNLLIGEV